MNKCYNRMERRADVPPHPDDVAEHAKMLEKSIKKREQYVARVERKQRKERYRSTRKYRDYGEDSPHIENLQVFKAVSFARAILAKDKLPIEICMHKAAKYYKVALAEVAREMGRLGSFVRKKKLGY
jgi:hypothetical protein